MVHNGTVKTSVQGSELDQVLTYPVTYTALNIRSVLSSCIRCCLLRRQPGDYI